VQTLWLVIDDDKLLFVKKGKHARIGWLLCVILYIGFHRW